MIPFRNENLLIVPGDRCALVGVAGRRAVVLPDAAVAGQPGQESALERQPFLCGKGSASPVADAVETAA
jgi:hypothetical protein